MYRQVPSGALRVRALSRGRGRGGAGANWPTYVALSVGTPICPYGIAYDRTYGLSTPDFSQRCRCSPLCGVQWSPLMSCTSCIVKSFRSHGFFISSSLDALSSRSDVIRLTKILSFVQTEIPNTLYHYLLHSSDLSRRVPREQKMLQRHLPRVIYHQVYLYTKIIAVVGEQTLTLSWLRSFFAQTDNPNTLYHDLFAR